MVERMTEAGASTRPVYGRVLLKLSGDAFAPADTGYGINTEATSLLARQLGDVVDLGIQTAVVVGGGNIWRGRQAPGIDRNRADYMGNTGISVHKHVILPAIHGIKRKKFRRRM
jgi:uridylate kinase